MMISQRHHEGCCIKTRRGVQLQLRVVISRHTWWQHSNTEWDPWGSWKRRPDVVTFDFSYQMLPSQMSLVHTSKRACLINIFIYVHIPQLLHHGWCVNHQHHKFQTVHHLKRGYWAFERHVTALLLLQFQHCFPSSRASLPLLICHITWHLVEYSSTKVHSRSDEMVQTGSVQKKKTKVIYSIVIINNVQIGNK